MAPSARKRQVGDAAIAVLAEHGSRGLTHRAVDQAAGLPAGTTSNYARTRAALLTLALTRIAELDAAEAEGGAGELSESGYSGSELSGSGISGSGISGSGISSDGISGSGLADGLAMVLDRWITDPGARRRVLARFELALEATRRPELRTAYDEMGRAFRAEAVRLLAASGSADPERDAWTLIAWMEGTVFYALAGAGATAAPARDVLRAQLAGLLATMIPAAHAVAGHDDSGAGMIVGGSGQDNSGSGPDRGSWGHGSSCQPAGGADAGQAGGRDTERGLRVRAEVGRLPVDRVPGRRRGRDREPERAADDALFPELVAAVKAELPERCVIDGEIVVPDGTGQRLDFEALQLRIHPAASRVELLSVQTPGHFIAFDLLALGDTDYTERPFAERRARLEQALAEARSPIHLTPVTTDREVATGWFGQFEGAGLDGLIAKPADGIYEPDKRVMKKIKHERTADCVVAGYRVHKSGEDRIGSLLLGLYKDDGKLASVGVIGAFGMEKRIELFAELQPLVTTFDQHPWNWAEHQSGQRTPRAAMASRWNADKDLSFIPLRPERVVEVRYDHMEGVRFRHTAQFNRWRPGPGTALVHLRPAGRTGQLQPGRDPEQPSLGEPSWLSRRRKSWNWPATRSRSAIRPRSTSRAPGSPSWTWCAITWPWRRARWAACAAGRWR